MPKNNDKIVSMIDRSIDSLNLDSRTKAELEFIGNKLNKNYRTVMHLITADKSVISMLSDSSKQDIESKLSEYGLRLHMSEKAIKVYRKNPHSILQRDFNSINNKLLSDELIRRLNKNEVYSLIDIIIVYDENDLFTTFGFEQNDIEQLKSLLIELELHLQMNPTEIDNYINRGKNPAKQESESEEKKATTDDKSTIGRVLIELNESSNRTKTLLKQIEEENNYKQLLQDIMKKYNNGEITESEYTEELNNAVTEMKKRRLQYE